MNYKKLVFTLSLVLLSTPLFAIGTGWKVEDDTTHRGLADIKALLEAQSQTDQIGMNAAMAGSIGGSINNANITLMHDWKQAELNSAPNLQKCIAVSRGSTGAALAGANSSANALRNMSNVRQNTFGNGNFMNVISYGNGQGQEDKDLCSVSDVRLGICKEAGKLGGWADKIESIRQNPTENNLSLTQKQVGYGQRYINSVTTALAPDPMGNGQGAISEKYTVLRKIWLQRMAPTVDVLNEQLAYSRGMQLSEQHPLAKIWNDPHMVKAYQEVRGKESVRPAAPSLKEIDQMMVYRPLLYSGDIARRESTTREIDAIRQLAESQAMTNYLLLKLLTEMQQTNALLATINANQLAPVTNDLSKQAGSGE
nr:hypothetical protein [uncultured Kingella sp.]